MKGKQGFENIRYKGKKLTFDDLPQTEIIYIYAPWWEYPGYWIKLAINLFRSRKRFIYRPGERPMDLHFMSDKFKNLKIKGLKK